MSSESATEQTFTLLCRKSVFTDLRLFPIIPPSFFFAETQSIVRDIVKASMPVFAKEVALEKAQKIPGLRAMFGETYPDPVRVLSVGADVDQVLADVSTPWGIEHSMEFCGGTHVKNSGDIGAFCIMSEEAVAKVNGVFVDALLATCGCLTLVLLPPPPFFLPGYSPYCGSHRPGGKKSGGFGG